MLCESMIDLGELCEFTGTLNALKSVTEVELIGMPKLTKCRLIGAFKCVKHAKIDNAGKLEEVKGLKEFYEVEKKKNDMERKKREEEEMKRRRKEEEERKRREIQLAEDKRRREAILEGRRKKEEEEKKRQEEEKKLKEEEEKKRQEEEKKLKEEAERIAKEKETLTISSSEMFQNADSSVQIMVILSNCCSDMDIREVDFSIFVSLRELRVGDNCFADVGAVRVLGLKQLETVSIGENSFNGTDFDSTHGHFCLKDCAVLRELKIGSGSFYDYDVCEIENVPSLEMIEMGDMNEKCSNFSKSDLLLKSNDQLLHITSRFA